MSLDAPIPAEEMPSPDYVTFTYPGWKVTQTAPPTHGMNPVWRITDPDGGHIATLIFRSLEDAVIHLFLAAGERQRTIDAARLALGDDEL